MGKGIDRATKYFIISKLKDVVQTVTSKLENQDEINTELYQAYLDYIRSVANILFKDSVVKEYQVFVENIELIQSQNYSNKNKLILTCRELLDLGIDTVNKY